MTNSSEKCSVKQNCAHRYDCGWCEDYSDYQPYDIHIKSPRQLAKKEKKVAERKIKRLADASNVHASLQNSINGLSTSKQDKLTFDSTPTSNSTNPVTSGGVKTYVDNINSTLNTTISKKADSTDIVQSDWNITDTSNKGYIKNKPSVWLTTNLNRPPSMNGVSDYTLQPLLSSVRANRLALLPADQIIIEKTTDGGITWVDAELPDSQKSQLFKGLNVNNTLGLPMIDGKKDTKCGLRVTITGMKYNVPDGTSETEKYNYWNKTYVKEWERYCTIHTLAFWICDTDDAISVKVQYATGENPNNWYDGFNDPSYGMTGWSGWNIIHIKSQPVLGGGTIQPGNTWNWRFTFFTAIRPRRTSLSTKWPTNMQSIGSIMGYGEDCWTSSNNLMSNDHLYTWDLSQNATFPANINATGKVLENGKSITDMVNSKLPLSGGTLTGALNFANNTWNLVGDDVYVGDHDLSGTFCVKGHNTQTGIALFVGTSDTNTDYARMSYDGTELNFNKTLGANISGNAATSTKATQDASGNVITTTYATKAEIPTVPTTVSSFTNDAGYLTTHQDLSGYQTKLTFDTTPTVNSTNPVTSAGIKAAIDAKTVDLSNYYTKTQVDTAISTAISGIVDGDSKSY